MGIKSLTHLVKKHAPDSIKHATLSDLSGKTVAIDTSLLLYKCLTNGYSEYAHVTGILYKILIYLSHGITPIFIFDGKPPDEKGSVLKTRRDKCESAKQKIQKIEESGNVPTEKEKQVIESCKKQSIRITYKHIRDIKYLLKLLGITYLHIDGEAEAIASELCRMCYVDCVVSEDMDSLTFGCPHLIRNLMDKKIADKSISIIDLDILMAQLQLTYDQFVEMCIMCGCDYCDNIPKIGCITAYNSIKKYENITNFLEQNTKYAIPEDYLDRFMKAKSLFLMYHDKLDVDVLPFITSELDMVKLKSFLQEENKMSEDKINTVMKRIETINKM